MLNEKRIWLASVGFGFRRKSLVDSWERKSVVISLEDATGDLSCTCLLYNIAMAIVKRATRNVVARSVY